MSIGEGKSSAGMIEVRLEESVEGVAALAIGRGESGAGARVIGIGGILPILEMAGIALGGKAQENSCGSLLVALFALKSGVRTEKRKTILMIFHLLRGNAPALNGVALLTVGTILSTMNVCVAIGTILSNVGEDRFPMTLGALHFFVHAGQRIFRFVVIELEDGADGSPGGRCMAILARDGQWAMGTFGRAFL